MLLCVCCAWPKDWFTPLPKALNPIYCEVSHLGAAALEALDVLVDRRSGVGRRRRVHALARAARGRLFAAWKRGGQLV